MEQSPWDRIKADAASYPMMYGNGIGAPEINQAEQELGVAFDPDYVCFLKEYGGAMIGPEPLLGLSQADVMGSDLWSVVEVTQRFRTDGWGGVDDWYIVSVDGAGNPVGVAPDGGCTSRTIMAEVSSSWQTPSGVPGLKDLTLHFFRDGGDGRRCQELIYALCDRWTSRLLGRSEETGRRARPVRTAFKKTESRR